MIRERDTRWAGIPLKDVSYAQFLCAACGSTELMDMAGMEYEETILDEVSRAMDCVNYFDDVEWDFNLGGKCELEIAGNYVTFLCGYLSMKEEGHKLFSEADYAEIDETMERLNEAMEAAEGDEEQEKKVMDDYRDLAEDIAQRLRDRIDAKCVLLTDSELISQGWVLEVWERYFKDTEGFLYYDVNNNPYIETIETKTY